MYRIYPDQIWTTWKWFQHEHEVQDCIQLGFITRGAHGNMRQITVQPYHLHWYITFSTQMCFLILVLVTFNMCHLWKVYSVWNTPQIKGVSKTDSKGHGEITKQNAAMHQICTTNSIRNNIRIFLSRTFRPDRAIFWHWNSINQQQSANDDTALNSDC